MSGMHPLFQSVNTALHAMCLFCVVTSGSLSKGHRSRCNTWMEFDACVFFFFFGALVFCFPHISFLILYLIQLALVWPDPGQVTPILKKGSDKGWSLKLRVEMSQSQAKNWRFPEIDQNVFEDRYLPTAEFSSFVIVVHFTNENTKLYLT